MPASGPDVYRCFVLPTNLAHDAFRAPHRNAESKAIVGARWIGVTDQILDVRAELVGGHELHGLAGQYSLAADLAVIQQHLRKAQVIARRGKRATTAALELDGFGQIQQRLRLAGVRIIGQLPRIAIHLIGGY